MKFRKLEAEEIDVRVGNVYSWGYSLLLYKDARCDMNILDETVGAGNWQRDHKEIKGNLYCGVGINFSDTHGDSWTWKWDCGTESNTEKEKGEASDSFKRACVNWGIGRELYTSPNITVGCEMEQAGNSYKIPASEKSRRFRVKEITYNDKGEIDKLIVVDTKGIQVYPKTTTETTQKAEEKKKSQYSGCQCELCTEDISDKVATYSMQHFGKVLCYNCQKRQPIEEKVV
jgi:hypothetical protein